MKIELDVDGERAVVPLTFREKIALRLLLIAFLVAYPAKYRHQVTNLFEGILGDTK